MSRKWQPPDLSDLISAYRTGESVNLLAIRHHVSRSVITRVLQEQREPLRGQIEANRLLSRSRTPEQHRAYTKAANAACRGRERTWEERCKAAMTKQRRGNQRSSVVEQILADLLRKKGAVVVQQCAVGPYNIDLAIYPVAVEILSRSHAYGVPKRRYVERTRYLIDSGWHLMFIWIDARYFPFRDICADHVSAFVESARRDPASAGQYRVIFGTGDSVPTSRIYFHNGTGIPSLKRP